MSEPLVDAVILGAGVAGQHLARALVASPWSQGRRIVVVDEHGADLSGRRWAYWSATPEPDAWRRWDALAVHLAGRSRVRRPTRHRYWQVRGEDLTARSRRLWGGRVEVVAARALHVEADGVARARVRTEAGDLTARWVFDGVRDPARPARLRLWFAGTGVLHAPADAFDEDTVTLVDDRIPAGAAFGFGYALPLGEREALVEVTRFARQRPSALDDDLAAYVQDRCPGGHVGPWRESGGLALGPPARSRRPAGAVLTIGTPAGAVRACTGYGFTRMRADAQAIAASLHAHGHPFALPRLLPRRHVWADAVLLDLVSGDPAAVTEVFGALFDHPDVDDVLDFLDGTTDPATEIAVVRRLPTAALAHAARGRLLGRPLGGRAGLSSTA